MHQSSKTGAKILILGALHLSRPCPLPQPPAARAPICAPDLRWSRGATSPNFPWNDTLRARAFSATCQNQNYWIRDDDLRKSRRGKIEDYVPNNNVDILFYVGQYMMCHCHLIWMTVTHLKMLARQWWSWKELKCLNLRRHETAMWNSSLRVQSWFVQFCTII